METYELPFATINILREDIAEVIVNEGVEMNVEMVQQYHDFLLSHLKSPFALLVNKIHPYSYDFPAQGKLATLAQINAMAVVAYHRTTVITTEMLASYPRERQWNLKIFQDRDEALAWLLSEQNAKPEHAD